MANWCRIKNGRVHETTQEDPNGRFPVGMEFQACPDNVTQGMVYDKDKDEYTDYVHVLTEEEKTQIAVSDAVGKKLKDEAIANGTYKEAPPTYYSLPQFP